MLSPHDRLSLFEALRPPPGFALDHAVGTSFTLDLEALLTAPIAFALFDASESVADEQGVEPVGLLEAIRRYAERITVFSQAGHISLPARHRTVFTWLEDSVVPVTPPARHRLFHPKIWVARYVDGTGAFQLRVLCATRNLTFDTSWDTLLRLDSATYRERPPEARQGQAPLGDLLLRLPDLAVGDLAPGRATTLADLAADVSSVELATPEPFTRLDFHVLGLGAEPFAWPASATRMAVVSPFLGERFLRMVAGRFSVAALVSRQESLDRVSADVLRQMKRVAVMQAAVDVTMPVPDGEQGSASGAPTAFGGLHAKLFVFDTSDGASVFSGSANATDAAFAGNVEVVAALHGGSEVGVDSLLGETPGEVGFDDLIIDYVAPESPVEPGVQEQLELHLGNFQRALANILFRAQVCSDGDDFTTILTSLDPVPTLTDIDELTIEVWPASVGDQVAESAEPGQPMSASFSLSLEGLTSFFAIRVRARCAGVEASSTFLVTGRLEGAPADRRSRLLAAMLRDADRLLRYLLLLLWDPDALGPEAGSPGLWTGTFGSGAWGGVPLLELLVRAADRHPARLDHIAGLLQDLGDEAATILPAGFADLWEPVLAYREGERS